jgi:hypothetical protein
MAKVGVITPVKARTKEEVEWLEEAINSIRAQSAQDWEMVIVNDHSPESLQPLSTLFAEPNIRGAKLPAGITGTTYARNLAAEMVDAELLLPLDADDLLFEHAIESCVTEWYNGGQDAGIVYGNTVMFTANSQNHYASPPYDFDKLLEHLFLPVGSLHRKSDWAKVGGWKTTMEFGLEDWEYWIALGELGVCGHRLNVATYKYRRHAGGRLAFLRTHPEAWKQAVQEIRSIHQDTYSGRRPMGCCGNAAANAGGSVASGTGAAARRPESVAAQMAATVSASLVPVEYIGPMSGFFEKGRKTGIRYSVEAPGRILKMPDGRVGVDPKDVQGMVGQKRGTIYRVRA